MSPFLLRARSRYALALIAAGAAMILAVRSAAGPFRIGFGIVVNSPFRLETIFWLATVALMLWPWRSGEVSAPSAGGPLPRLHLAAVLCVIGLAFSRNLADPFLSDDYLLMNVGPFTWKAFAEHLRSASGDGSWRPLGFAYYAVIRALAGPSPLKWHALGLTIHLANSALVFRIAWRLWQSATAATFAGAVFALNGTRPEAVLWTAGNYDPLAALCVLAALNVALSERIHANAALVLSGLLTATGVLFKESAYAAPFLLGAVLMQPQSVRRTSVLRFLAAWLAVCAALFAWRWHIFGGPGGYINPATGKSMTLSLGLATTAKALLARIWSLLLVPVNWDAPVLWWLPLSILICLFGFIALLMCRRSGAGPSRKTPLVLMAAVIGATLPAVHLALIGQSAFGSRILYLPGVAFALLLGSTLVGAGQRGAIAAAVMLLGVVGVLENNLSAWHDAAVEARAFCARGAAGAVVTPPETFEGVYLFRHGFPECVAAARAALAAAN